MLGTPNMLLRLVFERLEESEQFSPIMLENISSDKIGANTVALALVDTGLGNSSSLLEKASALIAPMHTIILSNCDNSALLNHWRTRGYERIISTNSPFSQLLYCLQLAEAGEPYHCNVIKELTKSSKRGPLSVREHEVFELLVKGSTNKNISQLLGVGEKSVHTYRKRLMQKLSCSSLAELIIYAQQSQKLK